MTEETAIRIAEALEGIKSDAGVLIALFAIFAFVFYVIALFKN